MSQNSARLGLGVAVLVAAAGIAFFFLSPVDVRFSTQDKKPAGEAYAAFPTPVDAEHAPSWDKPVYPEDNNWKYDLFTPVGIRWETSENQYAPEGDKPPAIVPFGIQLIALKHPHYRYRLSALVESETHKAGESTIVLNDTQTGSPLRGKVGDTIEKDGGKIRILGYENKLVQSADGARVRDTVVKVKDFRLNKEFEVRQTPLVFVDKIDAVFAVEGSAAPVWTAHAAGDKFEGEAGSYLIKDIDFETQSVTVAKTWTDEKRKVKTETKDLRPQVPVPPAPATPKSAPAK